MSLCSELAIAHPGGAVFANTNSLRAAIAAGRIRFPAILKPINRAGSIGVIRADNRAEAFRVAGAIDYAPVLVQDFIEGVDRSITVFAENGVILREVVYSHPNGVFRFSSEPELESAIRGLAKMLHLTGVFNFDARIDGRGKVWIIECNPRFFFNMDVAAVAGLNFADADAGPHLPGMIDTCEIRTPRAMLAKLLALQCPSAADWRLLTHWLRDPLVFFLVCCGFERKWGETARAIVTATPRAPSPAAMQWPGAMGTGQTV